MICCLDSGIEKTSQILSAQNSVIKTEGIANLFVILILVAGIVFIIFYFIEPLSVNNVDYYFLTDYKEIIEDLINKKKSVKCITYKSEEL